MAKKKKRAGKRRVKNLARSGKAFIRKAIKDPLVKEYVAQQKKLAEQTLKKAIRKAAKKIESKI